MTFLCKFVWFLICINTAWSNTGCRKHKILRNLALHKPANQSTTLVEHVTYGAFLAVDGIRQGHWVAPYCTHTVGEHNPFWYVDLGGQYNILRIEIVNRQDGDHGNRLRDISVVVADKYGKYDQTCGHFRGPGTHVPVVQMVCPAETRGRFVKVQMASGLKLPLTLCEVEVCGY